MRMCTIIIIFAYKYLHYKDNTVNYIFLSVMLEGTILEPTIHVICHDWRKKEVTIKEISLNYTKYCRHEAL